MDSLRRMAILSLLFAPCFWLGTALAQRTITLQPADVRATDVHLVPLADGGVALVEQCAVVNDTGVSFSMSHTLEPRTDGGRSAVLALQTMAVRSCIRALHLSDAGAQ